MSISIRMRAAEAIDRALPLVEDGLAAGVISEEEAEELLVEAICRTIVVEEDGCRRST